ncbi:MAG: hypothetical protein MJ000_09140 [Bacteroidales bacterium]|nr:hypothetical protein [Bacteroidales bacterium]
MAAKIGNFLKQFGEILETAILRTEYVRDFQPRRRFCAKRRQNTLTNMVYNVCRYEQIVRFGMN